MKIAVAGTGYVGLVTGVCLAENGHEVTCVDVDEAKIALMNQGISPIYEDGLEELMQKNKQRLCYTTDYMQAYSTADVIFIGVGTPEKRDGSANLKYVYSVADQIAENVVKDCVVVVKSTVPIGTNDRLEVYFEERVRAGIRVFVASNPEFLAQGTAVKDTLYPSRIIIGTEEDFVANILKKVYQDFSAPLLITNRKSAEMIKYASNDFLALKISYINEIANLCELVGADIEDVATGMGFDSRIGNKFLHAGIGYGGSCFPKDTKALHWFANFHDYEMKTIKAAIEVNDNQKLRMIKKARKFYRELKGLTISVLGLTFKPGTDDLREAPSLVNIPILMDEECKIQAWDPVGSENFKKRFPEGIVYCDTIEEALTNSDLCMIFTDWEEIKRLDVHKYSEYMRKPIVIDGRNCYHLEQFEDTDIIYDSVGRRIVNGAHSIGYGVM
ncbi:UDP-glucose/GDP-mannose dehydrogenase family protein [Cuneatibacter sp. NSJ-177]|uniref:UDP-glucose dehydrogenase family protein n=1 Tax=Cuneatibacter sp. NSJ-177 TaxID=2931401 RepID=UPI001FD1C2CE|nr:UDP-glucose/GDP-mannose dehydrogenase family protein [Cuneatibacter sp. NSJ-177]MCJ7836933.1 UDP-glucose/GDP-mannose dehydrogenase family protein [Cuneatibacter sp. NSJ-177]